ncbi:MAG: hypothetical protein GWO24_30390 [Akkermansiaceae bacterium]|nr:hypothetical protein [Akkermansiaceae bacterium]
MEEARAELARAVGRFLTGEVTATAQGTVEDTNGLAHLTEADALVGGMVYIRTDAAVGGTAPEGEWRLITDFDEAAQEIVVEYAFSTSVAPDDVYEVYKAPFVLGDWDEAVNAAISSAWPEVWERGVHVVEDLTRWPVFAMPAAAEEVEEVWLAPWTGTEPSDDASDPAQWVKWDRGFNAQRVPRGAWRQEGTPGTDLNLRVMGRAAPAGFRLVVHYKGRYAELGAGESTDLDWGYLLAAGRAELYQRLADVSGLQADRSAELQLMNHWQGVAERRKEKLGRGLMGMAPVGRREKK